MYKYFKKFKRTFTLVVYLLSSEKKIYLFSDLFFMKEIKNLKISKQTHTILKNHCDKNGLKMYAFLEQLIIKNCSPKKDIYGED
jgi:hypothetical protein